MMEEREVVISQPQSNKKLLASSELTFANECEPGSERVAKQTTKETRRGFSGTDEQTPLNIGNLNTIIVKQRVHALEVCFCLARNNRYSVCNGDGDQIYYVYEDSVCFTRQLTGAMRKLSLKMTDNDQNGILMLKRPAHCSSRCLWVCCSLQLMDIIVGQEEITASIYEVWSCCIPEYRVVNNEGSLLWMVKGGVCHCRCCGQITFKFFTPEGDVVASVTRECQGCHEFIGSANTFIIQFSGDLDEKQKLIILGGVFLVDLNYFEKQNKCW